MTWKSYRNEVNYCSVILLIVVFYELICPTQYKTICLLNAILTVILMVILIYLFTAFWMAKTQKYCSMDAIFPNLQKTEVSMGAASWTPRYV